MNNQEILNNIAKEVYTNKVNNYPRIGQQFPRPYELEDYAKEAYDIAKLFIKEKEKQSSLLNTNTSEAKYKAFQEKYFHNFEGFLIDCIDWQDKQPTPYQLEIARNLFHSKKYSVVSPQGSYKTMTAALTTLYYALTRDGLDWKICTTASRWQQLKSYLWPEIHKWASRLKWDTIGREPFSKYELGELRLKLKTGKAFCMTAEEPGIFEGLCGDYTLYILDEADSIQTGFLAAINPTLNRAAAINPILNRAKEGFIFVLGTPSPYLALLYNIHTKKDLYKDWTLRHITKDEAITYGGITEEWAKDMEKRWGLTSERYHNKVLGKFK